jgi:glycogen debranching enzyme
MKRLSVQGEIRRARLEWLHTNGAGSYASSTIAGMHTRRHHGLLVAAPDPARGHHVFLSHVDITVTLARSPDSGSRRPKWDLAKHQFPGVNPEATPFYLESFEQDPLPRWTYTVAGGELEVTLGLVRRENAAVLRYVFRGPEAVMLGLRPLLAARDFDHLQREHGGMIQRVELRPGHDGGWPSEHDGSSTSKPAGHGAGEMRVQPRRELPRICFRYEGTFVGSPDWWRRFEYLAERDRGLEYLEDLWTPGVFEVPLDGAPRYLVAAVDKLPAGEPPALLDGSRDAILAEDPEAEAPLLPPMTRNLATHRD